MSSYKNNFDYGKDQQEWISYFLKKIINDYKSPFQIFDVGANKGVCVDSMLAAVENLDYIIHAFDPHPFCYDLLCKKYKDNKRIQIYPDAVGNENLDAVKFNYNFQETGISYLYHSPVEESKNLIANWYTLDCKQVSIDSVVDPNRSVPFIKIDAEGHDYFVLKGCEQTLQTHRPFVLFEFSGKLNSDAYGYSPKEWYSFFQRNNYDLVTPICGRDLKFILSHFNVYHPDLIDILAVPLEKKHLLQ